jgi:hypothetical protein
VTARDDSRHSQARALRSIPYIVILSESEATAERSRRTPCHSTVPPAQNILAKGVCTRKKTPTARKLLTHL